MVHFIAMDIMKHALWRFMDHNHPRHETGPFEHAIRDGYALVDDYIGRLLAQLPPDATTIVMSDHGFGPLANMVNLNVFFMQKGLMKLKRDPWTQLKALAFRLGLTPSNAYQWIARIGLQNSVARVSKKTRNDIIGRFLSFDSVDWSRTVAYSMGHVGQVYLNVAGRGYAGREPHGIIPLEEYEQHLEQVTAALQELRDDDGRPILTRIIPGREVYHGPYAHKGPDLHLVLDDYNMIACPLFATEGRVITHQIRGDSGCHRSEGIFIAHGPSIRQGVGAGIPLPESVSPRPSRGRLSPEADILDLAPTILHLLGLPVPRVMDGRVLTGIFTPQAQRRVVYADGDEPSTQAEVAFSTEEAGQVEERLRSLGYL
jgi:predicted AlkP superfamily phosphohydrolase/phosphomutase